MNLVLCHSGDAPALWLVAALRARAAAFDVVTVEELVYSRRIVFRQDSRSDGGSVTLHDGRVLRPEAIGFVVNRIRYLPTAHFARAAPDDRVYAEAELGAFLSGWLGAVGGRVINPARPAALGGDGFAATRVLHCAALAGLPTPAWRTHVDATTGVAGVDDARREHRTPRSAAGPGRMRDHASDECRDAPREGCAIGAPPPPTHRVIAFDACVHGPLLPRPLQDGVRRLAALLGLPLLQVEFQRDGGGAWRFASATGNVDFRHGGATLVRALASAAAGRANAAAGPASAAPASVTAAPDPASAAPDPASAAPASVTAAPASVTA